MAGLLAHVVILYSPRGRSEMAGLLAHVVSKESEVLVVFDIEFLFDTGGPIPIQFHLLQITAILVSSMTHCFVSREVFVGQRKIL